jgi:hypothetical protein
MFGIWKATAEEWAAWAVTAGSTLSEGTEFERAATAGELLQRGAMVAHVDPDGGDALFHAAGAGPFPGTLLSDPAAVGQRERYRSIPAEDKPGVYGAAVLRYPDGGDLRGDCCTATGCELPAYCPATGLHSSAPEDDVAAAVVLAEAWALVAAEEAALVRVPMVEVEESDVVVEDSVRLVRFAGESE